MRETEQDINGEVHKVVSDHRLRSRYVQSLLAEPDGDLPSRPVAEIPRVLVQYWDERTSIPEDVQACIDSWSAVEVEGFERLLYDDASARNFIALRFDGRHIAAFDRCDHPAMRADYFRLCFISLNGGLYVDADDEYLTGEPSALLHAGMLLVQPLCYQISTNSMIDPTTVASSPDDDLIFYVNNNPIAAPPKHPVVSAALEQATRRLTARRDADRDIQTLTGPGNLTEALVRCSIARDGDFGLLRDWHSYAVSKWPLNYRSDDRNWRHWVRGEQTS